MLLVIILFILGLVSMYLSLAISSATEGKCVSKTLATSNRWLLIISTALVTGSIFYFRSQMKKDKKQDKNKKTDNRLFILFFGLLGVVLTVLGSIIQSTASKEGCKEATAYSPYIIIMGVLMLLVVGFMFYSAMGKAKKVIE